MVLWESLGYISPSLSKKVGDITKDIDTKLSRQIKKSQQSPI